MATLEIFPNLALYRLEVLKEGLRVVPDNLEDISMFYQSENKLIPQQVFVEDSGSITSGDLVEVDGKEGQVHNITNDYIDILESGLEEGEIWYGVERIRKPKSIIRKSGSAIGKRIETRAGNIISGTIRGLSWTPTYIVILSENVDEINTLTLSALVDATRIHPFVVEQIIFNTKPVLREERMIPRGGRQMAVAEMAAVSEEIPVQIPIEINVKYTRNIVIDIKDEFSIPLDEFADISAPRYYFLTISEQAKPSYGYMFNVTRFIPPGRVKVYDNDANLIGFSKLEVSGERVILKIAPEEKLLTQTIVETYRPEQREESTREVTEYKVKVTSNFDSEVILILEFYVHKKVMSADPEPSERLPGKLLWYSRINPGENIIQGQVTTQY